MFEYVVVTDNFCAHHPMPVPEKLHFETLVVHLTRAHGLYEFNRGHAVCSCWGNVALALTLRAISQRKGPFSSILS